MKKHRYYYLSILRKYLACDKRLYSTIFNYKRRKSTDAVSISVDWDSSGVALVYSGVPFPSSMCQKILIIIIIIVL